MDEEDQTMFDGEDAWHCGKVWNGRTPQDIIESGKELCDIRRR